MLKLYFCGRCAPMILVIMFVLTLTNSKCVDTAILKFPLVDVLKNTRIHIALFT